MAPRLPIHSTRERRLLLAFASLLACLLAGLAAANFADGARKAKVLGKSSADGKPRGGLVTGKATGIQTRIAGKRQPFVAPWDGHIVAWSIEMARTSKSNKEIFGEVLKSKRFGTDPYARIAILKDKGKARFELTKQTPAIDLSSSFGDKPIFTLQKPLRTKKGRVLGLTVPTYATNFANNQGRGSQWLASRNSKRCNLSDDNPSSEENIEKSRPHSKVGSTRKYGCRYRTERIFYEVYMVRSRADKK